jgi:hypothetical protein
MSDYRELVQHLVVLAAAQIAGARETALTETEAFGAGGDRWKSGEGSAGKAGAHLHWRNCWRMIDQQSLAIGANSRRAPRPHNLDHA